MVNKIRPTKLKQGDLVSIISPSAGLAPLAMHRIDNGVKELKKLGLRVKIESNALNNKDYVSDSIQNRVADLHSAFRDKEVKAVICTIGGNHSNQLLSHIDWDLIRDNPKIFVGYSDITVLHQAIYKKTGLVTFYGPCIMTEFGEYPHMDDYTNDYFWRAIAAGNIGAIESSTEYTDEILDWFKKEDLKRRRKYVPNNGYEFWREGKARGVISGGAIPSLNHLAGTEYWNSLDNKILFIDLPEGTEFGKGISIADVDTYLADLYNLGVFSTIKGLIIGRAYRQTDENLAKVKDVIMQYSAGHDYPVLYGVDIGHTSPMITLPMESTVTIDSLRNSFIVEE